MKKGELKLAHTRKTHAESAQVSSDFDRLDPTATRSAYAEIDRALTELAAQVVHTLKQVAPHLSRMQALLSQRGAARKKVLAEAKLPTWSEYAAAYAEKLNCSFRTIQVHIKELERVNSGEDRKPVKPAMVKRQPEPDWKQVVSTLVTVNEQCSGLSPVATQRTREVKAMLKSVEQGAPLPVLSSASCCGCSALHEGLARLATANPTWDDQRLSEESGCSLTIVRQANTRFQFWKVAA